MPKKSKLFFLNFPTLRKILFSCLTQKRRLWFGIFLFFIICGLISLPLPVWAGLEWLPTAFGNVIVSLIAQVLVLAFGLLLQLASWLLGWITSPSFIGLKFTDNPFVTPAWTLVRDLANMGFVIALVAIGLGTALRIGEYQAQKTLPWLIVMALLINFTPVICGVIIDASNIAMNFFLAGGIDFNFLKDALGTQTTILWTGISTTNFFEKLGMAIVMIAYNLFAALILFLFAFLFAVRYVLLWILVILSPLAFFAYVLPATRKYWSMWWNQFIQWCFIGVVAAFWLYLSEQIMMVTNLTSPAPPSQQFGGLSAIFSYTIPIIFLFMGLGAALSSAAPVAGAITGAVSQATGQVKGLGKVVGGAGKFAARGGMKAAELVAGKEKVQEKIRGISEKWAKAAPVGIVAPGAGTRERLGGWATRQTWGRAKEAQRAMGRAGLTFSEIEKERMKRAEKEAKAIETPALLHSKIASASGAEQIGLVTDAIERGGAFSAGLEKILPPEAAKKLGTLANSLGAVPQAEAIARRFIEQAEEMGFDRYEDFSDESEKKKEWDKKGYKTITDKLIDEAKSEKEVKQFSKEFWKSPDAMETIQKFWGGNQLKAAADTFGRLFAEKYMETAEGREKPVDWYLANNPGGLLYLSGNAAQDLGFSSIGGLERNDARDQVNAWRRSVADIEKEIEKKEAKIEELKRPPTLGERVTKRKEIKVREEEAKGIEEEKRKLEKLLERKTRMAEERRIEKEKAMPSPIPSEVPKRAHPGPGVEPSEEFKKQNKRGIHRGPGA